MKFATWNILSLLLKEFEFTHAADRCTCRTPPSSNESRTCRWSLLIGTYSSEKRKVVALDGAGKAF